MSDLVDVTIHLDETLSHAEREGIRDLLLARPGVAAADSSDKTPHLMIVEYDPDKTDSLSLLNSVKDAGHKAELVGL